MKPSRSLLTSCKLILLMLLSVVGREAKAAVSEFSAPASSRATYNLGAGWKFIRNDVPGAQAETFDDTSWTNVSLPHSFNETDSFRTIISHGGGDRGTFKGLAWYRKHFKIPAAARGEKVFIEFEGMRQAGDIFLNGKEVGLYENGVTAYGIDISDTARFGDEENILAVEVDNRTTYQERATHTGFEWNANDFNPDHGGINRRVWLHVAGRIYQTLPLFYGLQTTGAYIHASNFNIAGKSCDVSVESQVQNATNDRATVSLSVAIVDSKGTQQATFDGEGVDMVAGEKTLLLATGALRDAQFWSPDHPELYSVYTILRVNGSVVDVVKNTTGFRKTDFKGGTGTGGVYINDQFVYLKGFAQRASDEWAGVGGGYPDWMHDFTAKLIRQCNGNYVRWMHVSPQKVDVEAYDRAGIIEVCPAGDKERDVQGRQWDQRMEVMRASMIYYRNSPSILFWEAGNTVVTVPHMQQMVDLRKELDPDGGRLMGTRDNDQSDANNAITPISEFYGVMIGQDKRTDDISGPNAIFRGYSESRRDRAPLIETEDFRDEAGRRFWDDFSPPYFGFKKGANDTYNWNSETFALAQAGRYWAYESNIISNKDPRHSKWSGYASIYFSDSNADGRQDSSEVCRVSGKVDAVRLPKEIYFTERVMQNEKPDMHILGHWTYPAKTVKNMYVIANHVDSVELFINSVSKGKVKPHDGYVYQFDKVAFEPGTLRAVGYANGVEVISQELVTAGPPAAIKLTPYTSPDGFKADGQDVAFFDVEAVDARGMRCPTDDARIDFSVDGPAIWRGGYNSGKTNTTNEKFLNTECGINRVAIRSTMSPGKITVTATRTGLVSATVTVESQSVDVKDGLILAANR